MILILENAINWSTLEEAKEMILRGLELTEKTGVKTLSKFQLFSEENLSIIEGSEIKKHCLERMLDFEKAKRLFNYGKSIGQEVFFTCCFPEAVEWCEEIGVGYYKIRFYDRYFNELKRKIMDLKKPMFISSDRQKTVWAKDIIHLFCIPEYPAKWSDYYGELIIWQSGTTVYKFDGISDHSSDLKMLEFALDEKQFEWYNKFEYWERHVCLNKKDCLEREWASEFDELEDVLK